MEENRKQELLTACYSGVRDMLLTVHGAATFGARSEVYRNKRSTELVIKSGDGEFYLIKVQKSRWEEPKQ